MHEKEFISEEEQNKVYEFARNNNSLSGKKFIIFAQGRSGSSLLCNLLDSHTEVQCDGELLKPGRSDPYLYVDGRSKMSSKANFGFKVKCNQIADYNLDSKVFLEHYLNLNWSIVHLYRENLFRQALSGYLVNNGGYCHYHHKIQVPKTVINIEQLWAGIQERQYRRELEIKALDGLPYLEIVYEKDLLQNFQIGSDKIFDFIGVERQVVNTTLQKITPKDWSDFVENSDEVEAFLQEKDMIKFSNHNGETII